MSLSAIIPFADVGSWETTQWIAATLALVIGAINVGLGFTLTDPAFLIVGATFFVGVALYCTHYWHSIFYIVAAVHLAALGVVWILGGLRYPVLGVLTGVLSVSLFALVLYLFALDVRRQS